MNMKIKTLFRGITPLFLSASLMAAGVDVRLVNAVEHKDKAAVRELLKEKIDVNAAQPDGSTALAWAAHWDDIETADLLIAAGAKVNTITEYGATPLWEACNNASAPMVERLVKAGADVKAVPPGTGETILMRCARTGNPDAVKALLVRGADPNVAEPVRGQTALMWGISEGHSKVTQVLIEHSADIHAKSKGGFTPLLFASRSGDIESAHMLLEAGAEVNESAPGGLNALLVAIDSGHEDFGIFLVEKGANPNATDRDGLTPLHYALKKGHTYLKAGQRDDHYGDISLSYLFRPNMDKLLTVLLDHGANPNARITRGTRRNQLHSSDFLKIGISGATPFLLAVASGNVAAMRALLAKGANPKLTTNDGVTALMAAAGVGLAEDRLPEEAKGALEAVKMLVDMGFDVNAVSHDCAWTALHGAAYIGANDIIEYLFQKGARLDQKDEMGQTPLTIAVGDPNWLSDDHDRKQHPSTAALIRKLGGDPLADASGTSSVGGVSVSPLRMEN
jgi:uncharacterized protein